MKVTDLCELSVLIREQEHLWECREAEEPYVCKCVKLKYILRKYRNIIAGNIKLKTRGTSLNQYLVR